MRDFLRRQWHEWCLNLRHPRELAYWLVQNFLLVCFKLTMRVQLYGGEHYLPPAPATILLGGHKRDWDPLIFAISLYYQRGWWRPDDRRMAFTGREDMFTPGFLAEIVGYREWPRWAQWVLDHTALKPIIGPLRAYPIARFRECNLRHYLFEVLREQGNLPLTHIFRDEFLDALDCWAAERTHRPGRSRHRPSREMRISDVLPWAYRDFLMQRLHRRFLLPEQWQRYKALQREKVQQQIQALAAALRQGDTLWLAPEGSTSQDGSIRRVRTGLTRLLPLIPPGTRLLPANITYDFMTTGRMRACLALGPALTIAPRPETVAAGCVTRPAGPGIPAPTGAVSPRPMQDQAPAKSPAPSGTGPAARLSHTELSRQVTAAIARQTVVTMSMLGSRFLWNRLQAGHPRFERKEAFLVVAQDVQLLARQGAFIEHGLLDEASLWRRLSAFLTYGVRRGLLSRKDKTTYEINPAPFQEQPQSFAWLNPRYLVNELAALEVALAAREQSAVFQHPG